MTSLLGHYARHLACVLVLAVTAACSSGQPSGAAPYAALVMDARTGETLYARNADTRLHPASLTKMLTLYIAFDAIRRGEIGLDTVVTVSKNAAAQPPSRLGLKAGQKVQMRYLIRAAAVKSANDAASAIGDALEGSEAAFAKRMNRTAKALGMKDSSFRNANGLTRDGHLSTARDMTVLGRRLFYDFPQYYNIFSRRTTDAGLAEVANTNRRFLDAYEGADGIKTGFTNAAGFNLTASAQRGNVRILATVFGGQSTAQRNAKVAELLDIGFRAAPANAGTAPLAPVVAADDEPVLMSDLPETFDEDAEAAGGAGKTIRLIMAVNTSPRPRGRGRAAPPDGDSLAAEAAVAAMQGGILGALAEATAEPPPPGTLEAQSAELAASLSTSLAATAPELIAPATPDVVASAAEATALAVLAPGPQVLASLEAMPVGEEDPSAQPADSPAATPRPAPRRAPIFDTVQVATVEQPFEQEVVTRISTSGGRHWGVNVGRFGSRSEAERALLKTQLAESATLNDSLRKVVPKGGAFDATFLGLSQDEADLACRRLQARAIQCFTMGP